MLNVFDAIVKKKICSRLDRLVVVVMLLGNGNGNGNGYGGILVEAHRQQSSIIIISWKF